MKPTIANCTFVPDGGERADELEPVDMTFEPDLPKPPKAEDKTKAKEPAKAGPKA